MAAKYYFIYASVATGQNPNDQIEQALTGESWARLRGGEVYLAYSEKSARELRDLIEPLLGDHGHVLVGEWNKSNHSGLLASSTVAWIRENRL